MMAAETKSGKSKRVGQVRCPNFFERFRPGPGTDRETCSNCGMEWYISWKGKLAKVRKPVWENWEQRLAEIQQTE